MVIIQFHLLLYFMFKKYFPSNRYICFVHELKKCLAFYIQSIKKKSHILRHTTGSMVYETFFFLQIQLSPNGLKPICCEFLNEQINYFLLIYRIQTEPISTDGDTILLLPHLCSINGYRPFDFIALSCAEQLHTCINFAFTLLI